MNNNGYQVIRCPKCGSVHLEGGYDNSKTLKRVLWGGLLGLAIDAVKNRKKGSGAYWRCADCGCTFPME